jgi:hypothetical protein
LELLDKYFGIREEVFNYFGYVEDWSLFSLDDSTRFFWEFDSENDDVVRFADTEKELMSQEGNYYEHTVLGKRVYAGEGYTMIKVDTHTDGNRLLQVFDNARRRNRS